MLGQFLKQATADQPVYITDVREAFQTVGTRPFHLHVTLYDHTVRVFPLTLPEAAGEDEERFIASYVHAVIYNVLSALGALQIDLYFHQDDAALKRLTGNLDTVFQTNEAKSRRSGYGKSLNVNERILSILSGGKAVFSFRSHSLEEEPTVSEAEKLVSAQPVFAKLPTMTAGKLILGMDIGGTDIKLTVSFDGKLVLYKEFDWFPAEFTHAKELTGPILLLTRLLRAAGSLCASGLYAKLDRSALGKDASLAEMERGAEAMEAAAGEHLRNFDAIGLCFPDVVIRNLIVGGESYKTRGMRENSELDYEEQFAKITVLNDVLRVYVTRDGTVMNINDGPMAAFTAAVEQAVEGADISKGFFAHTLGTELGTGWIRPDGSIPDIPLEVYNFIIDLGSNVQQGFDANDVRSVNNFSTLLPGTLQKYTSQSGVFRLAAKMLPEKEPEIFNEALEKGLFQWRGNQLIIPTKPKDMRKPCLEFFMDKAAASSEGVCAEIFRQIGEYLAVTWRETQYILEPEAVDRTLFGRLVKHPACFRLINEGAVRREPSLRQFAADSSLANTPLMRQLEQDPEHTVAQFAQAVGAVYYGCLGLL